MNTLETPETQLERDSLDEARGRSGRRVLGDSVTFRMRARDRAELQAVARGVDLAEGALIRRILMRWLADRAERLDRLGQGGGEAG